MNRASSPHPAAAPQPAHPLPQVTSPRSEPTSLRLEDLDPPVPMLLLEPGFVIRWVSTTACTEFGISREQFVGRCWYELFPQSLARRPEHEAMFAGRLDRLDVGDFEFRCAAGTTRHFSVRLRPVRGPDGAVLSVIGVGEDVTQRVAIERELRRSEERFRAISSEARDVVAICDAEGTLLYANSAVDRMLGRDELIGVSAFLHMHPDDLPLARERFAALVADRRPGVVHEMVVRKQHADGSWRSLELTALNMLDHPAVRGIVINGRDVTQHRAAEAEAAASRERFETALWGSKAAYWRVRVNEDRADMSPNFWSLFGIDRAEWERDRHPWNVRLHPDDRARVQRAWDDCIAGRVDFYEIDYRLRTGTGWLWVHDRGRVTERGPDGRPLAVGGTTQDASARKMLEQALADAVATEQRRLGYDLHDGLGQELTGVQFLLASVANRLRNERPEDAAAIEEAQALVRGAIDTTRQLAQGLGAPGLRHGDLRLAIEELAADANRRCGLRVECRALGWARDVVSAAAAQQLYRIVQEALTNAWRHSGASCVTIELAADAELVELAVTDDGCGIAAPAVRTPGMGLTIMGERARSIGAELYVGRGPQRGTRVVVRLPADVRQPDRT